MDLEKQVEEYQKNGFVLLKKVLTKSELYQLELGIERTMKDPSSLSEFLIPDQQNSEQSYFFNDLFRWSTVPEYKKFILTNKKLPLIAQKLMMSQKVTFYHEHTLVKDKGGGDTIVHMDQSYYPVDGKQTISFWIPIDPIKKEENGLYFISGTHNTVNWYFPRKFATQQNYDLLENKKREDTDMDEKGYTSIDEDQIFSKIQSGELEAKTFDVEPGDILAFHFRTLHYTKTPKNIVPSKRRVVSFRYCGDDATITTRRPWKTSPPLPKGFQDKQNLDSEIFPLLITN